MTGVLCEALGFPHQVVGAVPGPGFEANPIYLSFRHEIASCAFTAFTMSLTAAWQHIYDTYDPRVIEILAGVSVQIFSFWIPATLLILIERFFPAFTLRHKLQPGHTHPHQVALAARTSLTNQLTVSTLHAVAIFGLGIHTSFRVTRELPSLLEIARDFAFGLVAREILFYYSHRLLHHPALYPLIHKKHHRFTAPIAYSAIYCTFTEHVLANTIPVVLPHTLLNAHVVSWMVFGAFEVLQAVADHSGFYLPFWPPGRAHDFHHEKFRVCYGTIGVLDWIHGTDVMPVKKGKES